MSKKIFKGVAKIAGGTLLGATVSKVIGGKKKAPAQADPRQTVMPMPDDEEVRRARRRSTARQMGRGGRLSTILTEGSETLG